MNLQRFVPKIIKQLDHYLLIHYPTIWQSRIHNVLYAVFATNLILGGLAMLMPVNLDERPDFDTWIWTFFIVSVTYLVIWMIHVGRFNIFKQYGKRPIGDEYLNFFLHLLSVALIASTMFAFSFIYDQKVRNYVPNAELAQDINALNLGAAFFPVGNYNYRMAEGNDTSKIIYLYNYHNFNSFGSDNFWDKIENKNASYGYYEEMLEEPNPYPDSVFPDTCRQDKSKYGINCPNYAKIIFNQKKSRAEQLELINCFLKTAKKYGKTLDCSAESVLNKFNANDNYSYRLVQDQIQFQFVNGVQSTINNIIRRKSDRNFLHEKDFWHFMWYMCFYITLIFMIYRNVRRRDFTLSVVSGIVIMVVSGIFLALTRTYRETEVFSFYFMIYCGLLIGTIAIFFKRNHSWFNAACLNLVVVVTPFMPLFYYESNGGSNNDSFHNWEIAGFVIFFLLLQVFFKRLYTTLWALPEK